MTLEEFATTTRHVISENGFEDYAPTAIYPVRALIKILTGVPSEVDTEQVALKWAGQDVGNEEEFLVAFKVDDSHFKVIRKIGPYSEDEVFSIY